MERIGKGRTLLERQAARESNARTYPRGLPIAIARASGVELWGVDGKRYLDFLAGAGTLALGHNHPGVVEMVRAQLGELVHGLDFPTPIRDAFVSELLSVMPPGLRGNARVHICAPTGSDGVEAAIKLCRRATGRAPVVAFQGSYHGMTAGALSVTSLGGVKARVGPLMPEVHFAPYAFCARCPLRLAPDSCADACAALFESILDDPMSGVPLPAAVLLEPVQGEGGSIVPRRSFVERVRAATRRAGVPLIADEVQSGLCRTGSWWAFEQFGIEPDVVVTSKALGGIGLPIAAIVYREELDVWEPGTHIGTFRGHQLAMAGGAAAIRFMREESLAENAALRGTELRWGLRRVRSRFVSDVRGLGLLVGVDFSDPDTGALAPHVARRVRAGCLQRGLLCELGGRYDATLRLLPPLVVSQADIREAVDIISDSILEAEAAIAGGFGEAVA